MKEKFYVPAFHFNKQQPCYCGSGNDFGECCGNSNLSGRKPKGIRVVNHFLSKTECNSFLRFAEKQKREWLTVVDSEKTTESKTVYKRHPSRVSQYVELGNKRKLATSWFHKACREIVPSTLRAQPQWFESPQLLRYGPGGKYGIHSDSDHFCSEAQKFYRFIDRDFSMLIYLNSDYFGGEIFFEGLNYSYKPKQGDLVIFLSNHIFSHESMPIISGKKYALVSWGALVGTPRVAIPSRIVQV